MSPSSAKKRFGIATLTGFRFDIDQGRLREPATGSAFCRLTPSAVVHESLFFVNLSGSHLLGLSFVPVNVKHW